MFKFVSKFISELRTMFYEADPEKHKKDRKRDRDAIITLPRYFFVRHNQTDKIKIIEITPKTVISIFGKKKISWGMIEDYLRKCNFQVLHKSHNKLLMIRVMRYCYLESRGNPKDLECLERFFNTHPEYMV